MEMLKSMKETLTAQVQAQMGNLHNADAKELGEAVDMIKDLAEAIYYCTITEAMEKKEKEPSSNSTMPVMYYTEKVIPEYRDMMIPEYYRDVDRNYGKMYYSGDGASRGGNMGNGGRSYYSTNPVMSETLMRDAREGRSPMSRRNYMESKETHQSEAVKMKELDKYMQELSKDITEMIEDSSPSEKQMLQQKIMTLANKIQ